MIKLRIGKSQCSHTKVFAALINVHGRVVRTKTVVRILGLIGWLAAPKKGHLPFLAGVWTAVSYNKSDYITIIGNFWRSLVSAALIAMPDFAPPRVVASTWMCVKWISVDTVEYVTVTGHVRYRVGICTPHHGRVFECPRWVTTQQVAELFGVWMLFRYAAQRKYPQVAMYASAVGYKLP